ncbi:MAG: LysM peptidoglycan-binding domain-containing protein [Litorimonas sp.]
MRKTLLLTASCVFAVATPSFAQISYSPANTLSEPVVVGTSTAVTNRVVQPVTPSFDNLISAPIEYDENGIAKAQYFKASDLTPEQNKAFNDEVRRVRDYQSYNGTYSSVPNYTYTQGTSSGAVLNAPTSAPVNEAITYGEFAPTAPATLPNSTSSAYEIELYAPTTSPSNVTIVNQATPSQSFSTAQQHVVAKGDTLYNLSKRYNVTVGQIQDENGLSNTNLSLGQSLRIPSNASNTSAVLDAGIAKPIFVSAPVRDGAVTRRIVKPVPTISRSQINYAVLKGDTLFSIAKRSCVSVNDLAAQNGITDPSSLSLGQKLSMPQGHCLTK